MKNNESKKTISIGGMKFSSALAILFIGLKLTNHIDWSWFWVLSPLWIGVAVAISILILLFVFAFTIELAKGLLKIK